MSDASKRELFEAAVVERLKESGFLEIEIRVECLVRCGEGYQDEVINAGWHYWSAALATQQPPPPTDLSMGARERMAKAMCERDGFSWNAESCLETGNGDEPEQQREYWLDKADAALAALAALASAEVEG